MANWVLKAHTISGTADGSAGPFKAPTGSGTVNAVGADLYLVWVAYYDGTGIAAGDLTDVSGNTYTLLTSLATAGDVRNKGTWFYKLAPATSSVEQWTLIGTGTSANFAGVIALAFSGSDGTTAPSTASSGTTSQTPTGGSIGSAGQLVVSGATFYQGDTSSIDSSFQIVQHNPYTAGNNIGVGAAWQNLVGGVAGSVNPQWTLSVSPTASGVYNLAFTPSAGGAAFIAAREKPVLQAVNRASTY